MSIPPPDPKEALRTAIAHIEHMAAWISARNSNIAYEGANTYSFESLGEDMPNIRAALKDEHETYEIGVRDGYESAVQDFDMATGGDGEFKGSTIPGQTVDAAAMKARVLARFSDRIASERELADLIAAYYRREIGRLMQQAEHWAKENYPLAVHHRVCKADSYFQIVDLCERFAEWGENPFVKMREELARKPVYPPGAWPPTAEINEYRHPRFVVEKLKTASKAAGGPA